MEYPKKRGRNKIDIIHSVPYSKIIFIVASGENYPENVSKILKKDYSTIGKQMRQLHTKEYLISLKEEGGKKLQYNKTLYAVNLNKIIENIFEIINENLIWLLKNQMYKTTYNEVDISESLRYLNKKGYIESIKNNAYFKKILVEYLCEGFYFGEISLRLALESLLKNLASFGHLIPEKTKLSEAIEDANNVLEGYYYDKTKAGIFDEFSFQINDSLQFFEKCPNIYEEIKEKFEQRLNEDKELQELSLFLKIIKTSYSNLILDFAYNRSHAVVSFMITKKHFEKIYEKYIKKYQNKHFSQDFPEGDKIL